jgi:flavorubredoxin
MTTTVLYQDDTHQCLAFHDLVRGEQGIHANQFLVLDGEESALIDPGGALLYVPLSLAVCRHVQPLRDLTWILATHQDPDVIGSVDSWLLYTSATVACSRLWGRFLAHSVPHCQNDSGRERYFQIPDDGAEIRVGKTLLRAIPAHFLHSAGNFHFYDPRSRILFSGDVGASVAEGAYEPIRDFDAHLPSMAGFHRRYMASNRACNLWVERARRLDIDMIVPQHGPPIAGAANVGRFLEWMSDLQCGADLLESANRSTAPSDAPLVSDMDTI